MQDLQRHVCCGKSEASGEAVFEKRLLTTGRRCASRGTQTAIVRVLWSRIGIFACLDAMPASPRCIRLHHRRALLMTVINQGRYALVPLPDPKPGPRKVDVVSMYNALRCRPRHDHS